MNPILHCHSRNCNEFLTSEPEWVLFQELLYYGLSTLGKRTMLLRSEATAMLVIFLTPTLLTGFLRLGRVLETFLFTVVRSSWIPFVGCLVWFVIWKVSDCREYLAWLSSNTFAGVHTARTRVADRRMESGTRRHTRTSWVTSFN